MQILFPLERSKNSMKNIRQTGAMLMIIMMTMVVPEMTKIHTNMKKKENEIKRES